MKEKYFRLKYDWRLNKCVVELALNYFSKEIIFEEVVDIKINVLFDVIWAYQRKCRSVFDNELTL